MNPGRLNQRIDLLEPVGAGDGQGGRKIEWKLFRSVAAAIVQQTFNSASVQGAETSLRTNEITIRKIAVELTGWRLRLRQKNEIYEILHCDNSLPDRTVLNCRKNVKR